MAKSLKLPLPPISERIIQTQRKSVGDIDNPSLLKVPRLSLDRFIPITIESCSNSPRASYDVSFRDDLQPQLNLQNSKSKVLPRMSNDSVIYESEPNETHKATVSSVPSHHRMSIFGGPLPKRKEVSYLRVRTLIYNFLQRPDGTWSIVYQIFVMSIIITGLFFFSLATVPRFYPWAMTVTRVFDAVILLVLVTEFVVRFWASPCKTKYQGWPGGFHFLISGFRLIDLFVIGITATIFTSHYSSSVNLSLDWFQFAQVFQIFRIGSRFKPFRVMGAVIWNQRHHLMITVYMCFLSLISIAFIMYFIENGQPETTFTSIPQSMWFGVVSLLTVGYGRMFPTSTEGQIVTGIFLLIMCSTFALPAGLLGTGLALKVQEQQRHKHFNKRRGPAARLIQCAWRLSVSSPDSTSWATWKVCRPFTMMHKKLGSRVSLGTLDSGTEHHKLWRRKARLASQNSLLSHHELGDTLSLLSFGGGCGSNESLSPGEKNCIRFLRRIKYCVARRKFKNAFRPYDIKDVIEQYTAGHTNLVARVRAMQSRLNATHSTMTQLLKLCHDLNQTQCNQFDRLENLLTELNQNLKLVPNRKSSIGVEGNTANYLNVLPSQTSRDELSSGNQSPIFFEAHSAASSCNPSPRASIQQDVPTITRQRDRSFSE